MSDRRYTVADAIADLGLEQISDEAQLREIVAAVLASNQQAASDRAVNHLVGQAMRVTSGKGNPMILRKIIEEMIHE